MKPLLLPSDIRGGYDLYRKIEKMDVKMYGAWAWRPNVFHEHVYPILAATERQLRDTT